MFKCINDDDCYGNGWCHVGECECLPNYEYAQDCSHYGCKYNLFSESSKPLCVILLSNESAIWLISIDSDFAWTIFYNSLMNRHL